MIHLSILLDIHCSFDRFCMLFMSDAQMFAMHSQQSKQVHRTVGCEIQGMQFVQGVLSVEPTVRTPRTM
jgi:hypothetical protein